MNTAQTAPIYRVMRHVESAKYYEGQGCWTNDRDHAHVFADLRELTDEMRCRHIEQCRVVEVFPRSGEFQIALAVMHPAQRAETTGHTSPQLEAEAGLKP